MVEPENDPNENQEEDVHAPPKKEEEEVVEVEEDEDEKKQEQPEGKKPSANSGASSMVEGLQNLANVITRFKNPVELGYDAACTTYNAAKKTGEFIYHAPGAIYRTGQVIYHVPGNAAKAVYNVGAKIGSAVNPFSSTPTPPTQKTNEAIKQDRAEARQNVKKGQEVENYNRPKI